MHDPTQPFTVTAAPTPPPPPPTGRDLAALDWLFILLGRSQPHPLTGRAAGEEG